MPRDLIFPPHHPERLGDGALAGGQHRTGRQHQDVLPGRGGEIGFEHGEPADQHRRDQRDVCGGGVTARMRLHPSSLVSGENNSSLHGILSIMV